MIMKMRLCVFFIGLMAVVLFSSCYLFTVNDYGVAFRNIGTNNIFVTSGIIGNYAPPVGILLSGKNGFKWSDSHSGIPETVKIKWKKADGITVEREVKIKGNVPKGFWDGDTMVFNINNKDEVILSFRMRNGKFNEINSKGNEVSWGR